jgi:hypothetical protein
MMRIHCNEGMCGMSLFDSIIGQLGGAGGLAGLARQVGIDPALAEKAVVALGQAHPEPGDTVAVAAARTGIDAGALTSLVQQFGGEGGLVRVNAILQDNPQLSGVLGMLDRDGDGSPLDDIAGMAGKLFGKS